MLFQGKASLLIHLFGDGLVAKLCLTLTSALPQPAKDCSLPGSSDHGVSQAGILEWVAISFSRGSPNRGVKLTSPALAGRFLTTSREITR